MDSKAVWLVPKHINFQRQESSENSNRNFLVIAVITFIVVSSYSVAPDIVTAAILWLRQDFNVAALSAARRVLSFFRGKIDKLKNNLARNDFKSLNFLHTVNSNA